MLLLLLLPLIPLLLLLYTVWVHAKYSHIPGPPRHNFLMGHTRHLLARFREDFTGFTVAREYYEQYGPVYVLWFALKPFLVVTDPDSVRDTVSSNTHCKLDKRAEDVLFGERFCGKKSIFVNKGDETWARNRKAYNKFFGRVHLKRYHGVVELVAKRLVGRLSEFAGTGQVVDMNSWLNLAACDIIGLVAFQWDIDSVSRDDDTFAGFLEVAFTGTAMATGVPLCRFLPQHRAMRENSKAAVRQLRLHCARHISQYQTEDQPESCLLDEILAQAPDDLQFQVDEMLAFFLAGQETVAHVLTFALCHVMRDPALAELCESEVEGYLAAPSFETLSTLEQTDMLMKETLRLYAPVPGLRRILSKDTVIAGYLVPKGTVIAHVLHIYGHSESVWGSDHMEFDPRRFSKSSFSISKKASPSRTRTEVHNEENRHPHSFLPFGIGPRVCIGREVAKIEFKVLTAYLLGTFRFVPVEGEEIGQLRYTSVKPKSGYRCYLNFI